MRTLSMLLAALLVCGFVAAAAHAEDRYNDIDGIVKDESGDVVKDATVRLMKRMGNDRDLHMLSETQTDKHGKFHFEKVAIGTFVVDAHKGDQHAMRHVDLDEGDANISVTLRQGGPADAVDEKSDGYTNIDGIVRNDDKDPVRGATVRLLGRVRGGDRLKEIDTTTTNKKGYFQFYKVADGTYTVEASDGRKTITREVTLKSGHSLDRLELTFRR